MQSHCPVCAKLSNKQLNTLRNSSSIEWSCNECQKKVSRRSSFITTNDDSDDEDDEESEPKAQVNISNLNVKQLVADISRELKKTFKEELGHIESSLNDLSDKIPSMEQSIKTQKEAITKLENKNYDLLNKNKNLELRVCAVE
ncbi:unnamed protein product [Pieris macdunnoughi]|uniref:Uncharacterized protein n=1 Tax=Pieris macdunnoughi TaxID=345717 RepID=A0A821LHJ6_9NEOP|nr:unnamed protein product [Pieris macdunnoughi]